MKNIQYIIIFTLLIVVALAAIQILNYKDISYQLLEENNLQSNKIKSLETTRLKLNQILTSLETNMKKLENNITKEQNNNSQLIQEIASLKSQIQSVDNIEIDNNTITIINNNDDYKQNYIADIVFKENDITGFN